MFKNTIHVPGPVESMLRGYCDLHLGVSSPYPSPISVRGWDPALAHGSLIATCLPYLPALCDPQQAYNVHGMYLVSQG